MLTAAAFVLFNLICYLLALVRGPYWGLFAYMNIYFNAPDVRINYWAAYLPFDRWSLITSAVLVTSLFLHKSKLSDHKFENTRWGFLFLLLSLLITYTIAYDKDRSFQFLYLLFTYCLIVYIMLRSITNQKQLRWYLITLVIFTANTSLNAYLYGERINERLEGFGSIDANGSNEFALLLAAIIPLVFLFLKDGNRYERIIAFLSLPFILNAFILCNSRGAVVALAGGLIIAIMTVADKKARRGMIILIVAITPVFLYLTDTEFLQRLSTLVGFEAAMEDESQAVELSSGRTEIWTYGFDMVADYPLGAGPNAFRYLARFYMPTEVLTFREGSVHGTRSAHSTYLQILVEQGAIGLVIWIVMCVHTSILLIRSFKLIASMQTPIPFLKNAILGMSVAFFSILLGGLLNSRLYYEFFWWQLVLTAIVYSLAKKAVAEEKDRKIGTI